MKRTQLQIATSMLKDLLDFVEAGTKNPRTFSEFLRAEAAEFKHRQAVDLDRQIKSHE